MAPNTGSDRKRPAAPIESEPAIPWSLKKRKLNGAVNSSPAAKSSPKTPKSTVGPNSSAVKRSAALTRSARQPAAAAAAASSPYDVPDSPDRKPPQRARNVRSVNRPTPKVPIAPRGNVDADAYDVPDSADELQLDTAKTSPVARRRSGSAAQAADTKTAREKKIADNKDEEELPAGEDVEVPTIEESPLKPRLSGRKRIPSAKVLDELEERTSSRSATPLSRARLSAAANDTQEEAKKATGRAERKVSLPLKGILTPSRRDGSVRRSKSVAFEAPEELTEEVFFEDIANKSGRGRKSWQKVGETERTPLAKTARSRRGSAKVVEPEPEEESLEQVEEEEEAEGDEEQEEDDEICAVCSKPDSKRGNQILFCDGCDKAYHQKCQKVLKVPRGDWYCNNCREQKEARVITAVEAGEIPNFEQHLTGMKRVLLDRCTGRRRIKLIHQEDAFEKAHQLVQQTVLSGEGNSMLVIGARGSGKTTLVESIVEDLSLQHKEDFHVVRLNGFIHTDDKLALKEIWRQLGKEMDAEDDVTSRSNYADTMASLLALLSHPSEMTEAEEGVTSQAVIFVIDEFDMFAAHPRQTLLYNLFDIAQARKAPIAVLGCTTRMDVVEMLEKRVKSRFSHRYVYLSLPRNLPAYWDVCRQGLSVDEEDLEAEGIDVSLEGHGAFQAAWNSTIEVLRKEKMFQNLLQYHYATSKSVSAFLSECILPLSTLSQSLDLVVPSAGLGVSLSAPASKLHILPSLSDLDLGLLIAAARLDIVAHTDTVNFAMAYDEYSSLMGRQRVQSASAGMLALGGGSRVWGRGVAGTAWERLVGLGLLVPAGLGASRTSGHGGLEGKMWKVDMALEEIPAGVKLNNVLARWCKEI
ncbi:Origin recognition complex subunit 4 [Colletotrichum sidae]|uniref:Origin recognition complex subunit 4 n=1 Tax=Colletotrichum sidae TaxID=1347389 RepID=A0A4V3I1T3_9PEZI|nr:Origin recognition complex subunit 4 [Colletotrichum sidae]